MGAMDQSVGKAGDGGMIKSTESAWLNLGGIHDDISSQYQKAPRFDFASAAASAKYLNGASFGSNGDITFSPTAMAKADQTINNA